MKFAAIAATIATVALAKRADDFKKLTGDNCELVDAAEIEKINDPSKEDIKAISTRCSTPCGIIYTGNDKEDRKANEDAMNKKVEAMDKDKREEGNKTMLAEMKKCSARCALCKNFGKEAASGASALVLGAAAAATAFALF